MRLAEKRRQELRALGWSPSAQQRFAPSESPRWGSGLQSPRECGGSGGPFLPGVRLRQFRPTAARDRKSHHNTPRPSAPPAMPRQIRLRRWKGNSLQDCTPPMAKTIRPRITPAGHQRMPTGRGGVVGSGDSDDMEGVFPPIRSRQALGKPFDLAGCRSFHCCRFAQKQSKSKFG